MLSRIERLRLRMTEHGVTILLVTKWEHVLYLSGFSGSSGALIVSADHAFLVSDFRYVLQADQEAPDWTFIQAEHSLFMTIAETLASLTPTAVAFEPDSLSVTHYQQLVDESRKASYTLQAAPGLIESLRLTKEPEELACIREAVRITDEAYHHLTRLAKPGVTEEDLALEAEWYMRRHGAEGVAFSLIVAAGEHSALPHAQPGPRALQPGDLVVVDMGARYAHYCADMTRTFAVAETTPIAREIYHICALAQRAGVQNIKPGMSGHQADTIVRDIIERAEYGEYFGHGTGHGVGLEIHESPRISRHTDAILPTGAVVTVEPGIYLPDVGGVRIEDLTVLTDGGLEILTQAAKPEELPVFG
ncbi:MAG TPA: aminopeptidase P family protein [Armatimonadota bacterium]|nr:aminopeptidase P family protein [Armatimonadota bacterium]